MPRRPCIDCGKPSSGTRCPTHEAQRNRARDQHRGTRQQRGYDNDHDQQRQAWAPQVAAGLVTCWRCHEPIVPGEPWDLGHDDHDRGITRGPEHANRCNRAAGGRAAH